MCLARFPRTVLCTSLQDFCYQIYPNLTSIILDGEQTGDKSWQEWLLERAILCPTNADVDNINDILINSFPGEVHEYRSFDKLVTECQSEAHAFDTQFLNKVTVNGVPDHLLRLKKGAPIMLLRNLDPVRGHVNGTRYVIKALYPKVIFAEIAIGPYKGNEIMIPRILFHPKDRTLPFNWERKQFPGMTTNSNALYMFFQ